MLWVARSGRRLFEPLSTCMNSRWNAQMQMPCHGQCVCVVQAANRFAGRSMQHTQAHGHTTRTGLRTSTTGLGAKATWTRLLGRGGCFTASFDPGIALDLDRGSEGDPTSSRTASRSRHDPTRPGLTCSDRRAAHPRLAGRHVSRSGWCGTLAATPQQRMARRGRGLRRRRIGAAATMRAACTDECATAIAIAPSSLSRWRTGAGVQARAAARRFDSGLNLLPRPLDVA